MALTPGTRLGVYEITAQIGEGGMGAVYRATDTSLSRPVAIKVLPDAFAADPDRLARFEREAKTLASLNHPHIAAIYAVEKSGGTLALVMELVEGDDLSQRIARGAIPIDEALPIARQIAEALEAAHEQGIIHRDLKPANIKVRADGTVKVLDFGLAKAMDPAAASSPEAMNSPTITSPAMTQAGMILGTAAYMAPEQAKGRPVDRRADVWAFGVVLFELLTGTRAFEGEGVSETLARVLEREPDWSRLPSTLAPALRTYLQRCLQKDPRQRIRDIGDVRLALEGAFETPAAHGHRGNSGSTRAPGMDDCGGRPVRGRCRTRRSHPAASARDATASATRDPHRDQYTTDQPTSFALSPDGRQIVFVASGDGASRLWLRSLATTTAQPLAGTEGATLPFWSPDSRSVGFFAENALKRLDLGGGAPQTLAPVTGGRGGTWNAEGVIVFAPSNASPLLRVSATGGAVTAVTTLGPQQASHRGPFFLPDGRRLLFTAQGAADVAGVYLGALDGSAPTRLTPDRSQVGYLPAGPGNASGPGPRSAEASGEGGWLLWGRAGTLVAQRLDLERRTLAGDPVTLADDVQLTANNFSAGWSMTAPGLVAYRTGGGAARQLRWMDPSGTALETVGDPDGTVRNPRVSPDGRRVAVERTLQGNVDLWLLDGTRQSRLTFDPARDLFPIWSPDGARIVFRSTRTGVTDLYQMRANGAGGEERLAAADQLMTATSWSPDGRFVLYMRTDSQANADLWMVPMVGDRTPSVFLKTPFRETWGVFSPDGRWVAYQSDASGRDEIYVRPFVPPAPGASADTPGALRLRSGQAAGTTAGGQWQVSAAGGIMPAWRPDGKALYYLNPAGAMMAAPIRVAGATLEPGAPMVLFPTRIVGGGVDEQAGRQYDVAPDGRFLINTELPGDIAPITLIQHWNPEDKK